MAALRSYIVKLLKDVPRPPAGQDALKDLVSRTLVEAKLHASSESWKSQWEYLLKAEIFKLAAREGKAVRESSEDGYYLELRDKLDLVLLFTEQDACEQTFPFIVLQDLLESQTIESCSQIFSWIEDRAGRLTEGMVPQKGKALILLRTLNDLLRRLSKTGSTTIFCGRILTFLSGVFPLGERSGVNLRGEYGPTWEGVSFSVNNLLPEEKVKEESQGQDVVMDLQVKKEPESQNDTMEVDTAKETKAAASSEESELQKKEDFYNTFWELQLYFSKPTIFASPDSLENFKTGVNKVMPVIKEATAKERAMMGSRNLTGTAASLKRKREPEAEETNLNEYFFAKFLTSPDLLDLEIADTHFRRQFLLQLLILLQHLLTFTKAEKEIWSTPRNRSLQMEFTLDPSDAQWVQDATVKVIEELKQTTPNGRQFADTVSTILEREKNWIKWKNELCAPFDKEPWSAEVDGKKVGLWEATKAARSEMQKPPENWEWSLGTEPLTEIWEMGYRDLSDLERPFHPGDVKDFLKKIKQNDARIEMRKRQLAMQAERIAQAQAKVAAARAAAQAEESSAMKLEAAPSSAATGTAPLHPSLPPKPGSTPSSSQELKPSVSGPEATPTTASTPVPPAAPPTSNDEQVSKLEEGKQRVTWLALRTARDQHLQHFGKIGTGDIELLAQEIENEKKRESERVQKGEAGGTSEEPPQLSLVDSTTGESPQKVASKTRVIGEVNDKLLQVFPHPPTAPTLPSLLHTRPMPMPEQLPALQNVIVTGGAGYIGSHIIYILQKTRRYKVISIDNNHNSLPAALNRVSQLSKSELPPNPSDIELQSTEIDAHKCDLSKPEQVRAVFEKYGKGGIWGVIHVAAFKAVGESTEIPLDYYLNNVSATITLLRTMNEFDCHRIVYSSSATVYGTPPIVPIPETTRLQADSPYGKTKVMAETILEDLCYSDNRWRALALRYFNPAGAHPSGVIGEDPLGRPGNLLPLLAHMAIGRVKESTLKVFGNDYPTPDGTCVRDYLHVLDLAQGHVLALDALRPESTVFDPKADHFFKGYNLGRGAGLSVLQILEAMRKATGFDYKYEIIGRRRGDVPDLTADPSLAEKELGFHATQDLETMCRDLWNWQTKNPQGYAEEKLPNGKSESNGCNCV
ncbi:hypothetical protein MD484_g2029, partial [Candolleomyces efflorescens]